MVAVDTNILVYYHRIDNKWHNEARKLILDLHESGDPWAIPWPCVAEFLSIVTHPKIFNPPSPLKEALKELEYLRQSPHLYFLAEDHNFFDVFDNLLITSKISGPRIHDARIAAIALQHKISVLYSMDRDFSRFKKLKVVNPF